MAITKLLSGLPQRTMDQATFDAAMAQLMTDLAAWGAEVNSTAALLNAIAAGGAYAIPYKFSYTTNPFGQAAGGWACWPTSAQTTLYVDTKNSAGASVSASLANVTSSNASTIKAQARIVKQGDASKWALFNITAAVGNSLYVAFTVSFVEGSSSTPFTEGDAVILFFQRTGDKGDTPSLVTGVLHVRDEKTNTTPGGTATGGANTRALNTVKKNSITGASLASNQVTLPAGTYRIQASAPVFINAAHQSYLYNVTDATVAAVGTSERANGSAQTRSFVGPVEIVLSAQKMFELRQYVSTASTTNDLGQPASSGQVEVYSELFVEKLA